MTAEQKAAVLAAFDTYAEVFGPRLAHVTDYNDQLDACCAIGVLGLFDAVEFNPKDADDDPAWFDWSATAERWGLESGLALPSIIAVNDQSFLETPEARFKRVRQWVVDYSSC